MSARKFASYQIDAYAIDAPLVQDDHSDEKSDN